MMMIIMDGWMGYEESKKNKIDLITLLTQKKKMVDSSACAHLKLCFTIRLGFEHVLNSSGPCVGHVQGTFSGPVRNMFEACSGPVRYLIGTRSVPVRHLFQGLFRGLFRDIFGACSEPVQHLHGTCDDACYDRGAPLFFLLLPLNFGV